MNFAFWFLKQLSRFPYFVLIYLAKILGFLAYYVVVPRRKVGQINLAKCYPTLPEKTPVSQSNYGENVDWDTLEHFPISHEEMIEFLNHFEKERHHNDRPFGNNIHVNEYNWTIQSDDDSNQNES